MRYFIFLLFFCLAYTQLNAQVGFTQSGKASFYSDRFHGAKTNSGEKYDMNAYTAAHRDLPLNTKIKVTNLKNNKTVVLRINDRGPFHHVRILDVSKAAAKELDMISQGVANITLEVVEVATDTSKDTKPPTTTPTSTSKPNKASASEISKSISKTDSKNDKPSSKPEEPEIDTETASSDSDSSTKGAESTSSEPEKPTVDLKEASSSTFKAGHIYNIHGVIQNPKGYGIQVGYFSHIFNALRFCKVLTDHGFTQLFVKADIGENGTGYRILIGDYKDEDSTNLDIDKLREKNIDYLIKKYPEK